MKLNTVLITALIVLALCSASNASTRRSSGRSMERILIPYGESQEEEETSRTFDSIGIYGVSLHPLNLWSDEPNPDFDVLSGGIQVEGKKVELLIGYAYTPSHPEYTQEMIFGANYLLVREESTRIGFGVLSEFKFDDGFNLPSDSNSSIYQVSLTMGFGLKLAGSLWFYMDTYLYKGYFTRSGVYGLSIFEIGIPVIPRLVLKF